MKHIVFSTLFLTSILVGCGSAGEPKNDGSKEELKKEIISLDSLANEAEKADEEIKSSSENLDKLLEDL